MIRILILILIIIIVYEITSFLRHGVLDDNHPILNEISSNFSKIDKRLKNVKLYVGENSYTQNKKWISLCIRDPQSGHLYDMNTINYVAAHEYAHVISKSYGETGNEHNAEFKANFNYILKRAQELGIYNPDLPIPTSYCRHYEN